MSALSAIQPITATTDTVGRMQTRLRETADQLVGSVFYGSLLRTMRASALQGKYGHGGRGEEVFAAQLDLAGRLGKPVVVHTREALDDTLAILRQSSARPERVVFHSFTGDTRETQQVLEAGCWVSYSGIATFNKADALRQAAAVVPDDRIMVETDAPYLSPEPVRKMKTNEPANVAHVARCLARARGAEAEGFAELTTANAASFFALDINL